MTTKIGQLYLTMASTLKPLQCIFHPSVCFLSHLQVVFFGSEFFRIYKLVCVAANRLSGDSEIIEDVRRLCVVFEHVEKLVTLAASLHRKFLQAARLREAIFSDYYSFYLPKMGTGSVGGDIHKVNATMP